MENVIDNTVIENLSSSPPSFITISATLNKKIKIMNSPVNTNNQPEEKASFISLFDNDISAEQDLSGFELGDQVENIIEASPVCEKAMDAATAAAVASFAATGGGEMSIDTSDDIFNMPITGFSKKRKTPASPESKRKRSRDVSKTALFQQDIKEVGEISDLEMKTPTSFIKPGKNGKISSGKSRFNFFLATAFAMTGDFEHLRAYSSEIDEDVLAGFIMKITPQCFVHTGDGHTDVFIRRIALNDIFATSGESAPTKYGETLTKIVYGKSIVDDTVTKSNIRSMFTHMVTSKKKLGVKYMVDNNETEYFFQFRIGAV